MFSYTTQGSFLLPNGGKSKCSCEAEPGTVDFQKKLYLPPAPTPVINSERDRLLLMQSECYSIERFADYLPMPMKSSHFFKSGYLFFKGYLTEKHSQNRQNVEPLQLN